MRDGKEEGISFQKIHDFLVSSRILDRTNANIYVLGLKKGTLTTRDVTNEIDGMRQTTAGDRLTQLASRGYFEQTPPAGEGGGGRGRARKFRVIHPRAVLKKFLEGLKEVQTEFARIDEHLELLGEEEHQDDVWMIMPQSTAISRTVASIIASTKSIRILSHDCTWVESEEILEALKGALAKKVDVDMIATSPSKKALRVIKDELGIEVRRTQLDAPAFVIIDEHILILPIKVEGISPEYHALRFGNRYLVGNFLGLHKVAYEKER